MESAYLYVRVSTDEQKKTGYSLIEQEERLLAHCKLHKIQVKGIFREDFSAKDFNRPEWKKLIATIKRNRNRPPENILFLKWDRFSRNIGLAYQMIGILKQLNVQTAAIDQPVDFDVPESIVTLAIYLSIPEAENSRRGRNTADGMRRAKKLGRWPAKAPIGYINQTAPDGKRYIVPKQPEADYVKWSFEEMAKGLESVSKVRKRACLNGFACGRNNFWKVLRNPIYYGIIVVPPNKSEDMQFVKGIHEPIISKTLFDNVQHVLSYRRQPQRERQRNTDHFPLRGFLKCPWCNRPLTGSFSTGSTAKYRYYHCPTPRCKGRFRGEFIDEGYENLLAKIILSPGASELLELVLHDKNAVTSEREYNAERRLILSEMEKNQLLITNARKLLISEKIDADDFHELKNDYQQTIGHLNDQLNSVNQRLINITCKLNSEASEKSFSLAKCYSKQDIVGKRHIISLFTPGPINRFDKSLGQLKINKSIAKILEPIRFN